MSEIGENQIIAQVSMRHESRAVYHTLVLSERLCTTAARAEIVEAKTREPCGELLLRKHLAHPTGNALRRSRAKLRPLFLFAPGAGAPSSHPWMQRWKERLTELGDVRSFDYDYMREGRKRPDRLPQLIAAHRAALTEARQRNPTAIILIGKSMGSRIGCHVSLVDKVDGLICFGYPLHGAGDPSRIRDEVLRALVTPILFLQGTRDPLCPLESLEQVRAEMKAPTTLHVVEGGDHSLLVSKRHLQERQETQSDVDRRILGAISAFLRTIPGAG